MARTPEGEATGWRKRDIVNDADHHSQRTRGQPLFHRPQRLFTVGCFRQHDTLGRNSQVLQSRRMKPSQLPRHMTLLTPQQGRPHPIRHII